MHADEVLTAFLELESQMAVKEMAFQEKACFASVAGCTAKVLYTAVGGMEECFGLRHPTVFNLSSARLDKPRGPALR